MPDDVTPGIYIQEDACGPRPIEGVATSTAAFLGETERGLHGCVENLPPTGARSRSLCSNGHGTRRLQSARLRSAAGRPECCLRISGTAFRTRSRLEASMRSADSRGVAFACGVRGRSRPTASGSMFWFAGCSSSWILRQVDRTTMTQDDILNGRLICEIGIAALRPAEFGIFRIFQKTAEVQSQILSIGYG